MGLGVLGASRPIPRIDLGPECMPGYPCSQAAENRHELERGLTVFLDRSRTPVDPFTADAAQDPLLAQYQESVQTLSHRDPAYAQALTREAAWIAQTSTAARGRQMRLSRSPALHGPYYMVPAPPAFLLDYATTGLPTRIF